MPEREDFNTSHPFKGSVPNPDNVPRLPNSNYWVVEDKKVVIGKAFAEKILLLEQVPGDRGLINGHVEDLMQHMVRGTFLYENHVIATAHCQENNKDYRLNAQHTCWAAYELEDKGVPVEHGKSRLIRYEAKTLADIRQLYSLYDRLKTRTKANVVVTNLYDTPEYAGIGTDMITRLSAAYGYWRWESGSERTRHDANDVSNLMMTTHLSLCKTVAAFMQTIPNIGRPEGAPFRRSAVMASMFEIFEAAPHKAVEFWTPVCDGLNLSEATDPRHKLRQALVNSGVMSNAATTAGKKKVEPETMYRWGIHAWNAWRRGDPVHTLRVSLNSARPKATRKAGRRGAAPDDTGE